MQTLHSSTMFTPPNSHILSNDVEMLQTDVMRFFAILCLCLMAIFALVKALPMSQTADRQTNFEPADRKNEVRSLQMQIATLKKKLTATQVQVQAASAAATQSSLQAQKAAEDEQKALGRFEQAQQELKDVSQSLDRSRRDLKRREVKLAGLIDDIDKKQKIHAALQSQLSVERQKLDDIPVALDPVEQNRVKQKKPLPKPVEQNLPQQPAQVDYILRFASDSALQKLISQGKVNLFAMAGKQTWQLGLTGGQPVFSATPNPRQVYEMEPATVPIEYVSAFKRQLTAVGPNMVTWGVTLPAQTKTSIHRLLGGQKGGDLLIMPDGEVVLN